MVCPGVRLKLDDGNDETSISDTDFFSSSENEMDTTFDFGDESSSRGSPTGTADLIINDSELEEPSESESDQSNTTSGEEIWDSDTSSESERKQVHKQLLLMMWCLASLFLLQLFSCFSGYQNEPCHPFYGSFLFCSHI